MNLEHIRSTIVKGPTKKKLIESIEKNKYFKLLIQLDPLANTDEYILFQAVIFSVKKRSPKESNQKIADLMSKRYKSKNDCGETEISEDEWLVEGIINQINNRGRVIGGENKFKGCMNTKSRNGWIEFE